MSFIGVQMARQLGAASRIEEAEDKGTTVRPSATANFYVDSLNKQSGSSGDFLISKKQALFNGFFNRIGVTEVVVDWGIPNVAAWWGNNNMTVNNVTTGLDITPTNPLPDGFYTAIQALSEIAALINAEALALGDPLRLSVQFTGLDVKLVSTGVGNDPFYVVWQPFPPANDPPYALARQLFTTAQLAGASTANTEIIMASPRLLGTTYIDIVSPQLTYNQDLKDGTTADTGRDVLYRWYFADDPVPTAREKFPYTFPAVAPAPAVTILTDTQVPVLQGYTPFVLRRALPYPKQIRWENKQPIGQVAFQVYDDRGRIVNTANFPWQSGYGGANFQFQMSMLLSEN